MDLDRSQIQILDINNMSDVGMCRRKAVGFVKQIGFNDVNSGEIAIVITELATNVIKHGGGKGKFLINKINSKTSNEGIEIWCFDSGNGIENIQKISEDGYSNKSSLGVGIGSIRRFSDEFDLNPKLPLNLINALNSENKGFNNCIRTRKWKSKPNLVLQNNKLIVGAATRPYPGEQLNGDNYLIVNLSSNELLVAVIDGLGHGRHANLASSIAKEQILLKKDQPIDLIMQNVHTALKSTRGAVVGISLINTSKKNLIFSGIGNIEGQVNYKNKNKSLISFGGILGHNMRTPRIFEFDYKQGYNLCMYSDGIKSNWKNEEIDWEEHPQTITEKILKNNSRNSDDATIIIIKHIS